MTCKTFVWITTRSLLQSVKEKLEIENIVISAPPPTPALEKAGLVDEKKKNIYIYTI